MLCGRGGRGGGLFLYKIDLIKNRRVLLYPRNLCTTFCFRYLFCYYYYIKQSKKLKTIVIVFKKNNIVVV